MDIALVSLGLGAGRNKAGDTINYAVGIYLDKVRNYNYVKI